MSKNAEASDIIKGCTDVLKECRSVETRTRKLLLDLQKFKRQVLPTTSPPAPLRDAFDVTAIQEELHGLLSTKIKTLTARFKGLDRGSCKRTAFHRAWHHIRGLDKWRLGIFHLLHSLATSLVSLVTARQSEEFQVDPSLASDWLFMLETIDKLNRLMAINEDLFSKFTIRGEVIQDDTIKDKSEEYFTQCAYNRWHALHENSQPGYGQRVCKQFSSSQVLRLLAIDRAWSATSQLTKSIISGFERRTLENAADEVSWLTIPTNITPSAGSLSGILPGLSKPYTSLKNKDGSGNKRKNRSSNNPSSEVSPSNSNIASNDVILANDVNTNHLQLMEDYMANEEGYISEFLSVLSKVRHLWEQFRSMTLFLYSKPLQIFIILYGFNWFSKS